TLKSGFFGVDGVFDMDANFQLKVNTRSGGSSDQYDLGVARGMSRIDVSGEIHLLSTLTLQASGFIESSAGVFRLNINGSISILEQSVSGSGYFSSEGEFSLAFNGALNIGANGFGVFGSAAFSISRLDNNGTAAFGDGNYQTNVFGSAQGSVQLFGFTLASASIAFGLEGSTGRVYITPRIVINLLVTKIDVSTTFNLFYIQIPKPIYLAGNEGDTNGTGFNRGTLYLNVGSRAHMRNMSEDESNEGYVLTKIAADPDYPGEIIRVQAFGRSQTFRGVTAIVADAGTGFDYISIGPGILAPVTMIGGDRRDWLLQYGSGDAIIEGGPDDDELHGGSGTNTFRFGDGFGRDAITSESSSNNFDFSSATENLIGSLATNSFTMAASGSNRLISNRVFINGREALVVPNGDHAEAVILQNHGFAAGTAVNISSPDNPEIDGTFTVLSASTNVFVVDSPNYLFTPPSGTSTNRGPVWHDGIQTAFIRTSIPGWSPGFKLSLTSSTNAYNGDFEVQKISDSFYSFTMDWQHVREAVETSILPNNLTFGQGADALTIPGSLNRTLNLFSPAGGLDTLRINGSLQPTQTIVPGSYQNLNLHVFWTGIDRLELVDPTVDLTISGTTASTDINLGGTSLGITARSVSIPVALTASAVELNVRDSLQIIHDLQTSDLNLRVFGDNQSITLPAPVVAAQSIQLIAPDGTIHLPAGTQFTSATLVLKAKSLDVPDNSLSLAVNRLTLITHQSSTAGITIANDRSLILDQQSDSTHMVQLDGTLTSV
ncbi:MAG: hypothetical protein ACK6D6_19200, partial [Planctomyces sp.]